MWILIALFTLYSQKDSVHRNDCWEQLSSNARYLDAATYIQDNPPRANRAQLHVPAFTQLLGSRREGTRLIQCSWCTYYFIFQGTVEMRIGKAQTIKAQFLKVRKALFWHTLGFERRNLWEWDYEEMENIVFTSVVNNQRTLFSPVSPQDHMKQMKSRTSEAEFLRGAILSIIIVRWSKHSFQSNHFFFLAAYRVCKILRDWWCWREALSSKSRPLRTRPKIQPISCRQRCELRWFNQFPATSYTNHVWNYDLLYFTADSCALG